jgi:Domain of Unknown Function (DUF1080)
MKKNKKMKRKLFVYAISSAVLLVCSSNPMTFGKTSITGEFIAAKDTTINFEKSVIDKLPDGFTQTGTGKLQNLDWKIVNDKGNRIVAQLSKNEGDYYNLLILDKIKYQDFTLTVKLKAVAGEEDQGGGLVWRYIDNNNYYIARCNPLEHNFRLYRVVSGNRKQLISVDSDIKTGIWFTMTIEMKGNRIFCSLNGKKMIEATDDTFKSPGNIGLWTKADAVTYFDDITVHSF